jgi:integrase
MMDGKRVSITAETEEEYYIKARAIKAGLIEASKQEKKISVGAALDEYIESKSNILSPSTIKGYKSVRENRFQGIMSKDVRSGINWQKVINEEAAHAEAKTVSNAWHLVQAAVRAQGVEVSEMALPKIAKSDRPWLDYEQIQVFLKAVKGQPCEMAALLALHGLRRSELLAMTAEKINLEKGTMQVEGAKVYGDGGTLVDKKLNKTASSRRTVHIMIPRLEELVKGKKGTLVTTMPNTSYVQINRICEAAGLPKVGVHGLRHSFASLAYHLGWSEAATMREGGWTNSKTVHGIYTHLAAQDLDADALKMRQFYAGEQEKDAQITDEIANGDEKSE